MAKLFDGRRGGAGRQLLLSAILLLVGLIFAPGAQAQGAGGMMNMSPEDRAAQRIGVLTERVQLTPQQSAQLKPVLLKQFTEQTALMRKFRGGGDRAAMMREMQALGTRYDEQIIAVLTADQKVKYAALQEEERERRTNRGGRGG